MLLVKLGGQIVVEEDGPGDHKGPDVGVVVHRERHEELGALDLGAVDERRHDGQRRALMESTKKQNKKKRRKGKKRHAESGRPGFGDLDLRCKTNPELNNREMSVWKNKQDGGRTECAVEAHADERWT